MSLEDAVELGRTGPGHSPRQQLTLLRGAWGGARSQPGGGGCGSPAWPCLLLSPPPHPGQGACGGTGWLVTNFLHVSVTVHVPSMGQPLAHSQVGELRHRVTAKQPPVRRSGTVSQDRTVLGPSGILASCASRGPTHQGTNPLSLPLTRLPCPRPPQVLT